MGTRASPPTLSNPSAPSAETILPDDRHNRPDPATSDAPTWLALGPASRLLGVDPDTLRRWADEGRIETYVTPGRHRRFERHALERLAASRRPGTRPLASLGAGPARLTRAYQRRYASERATGRLAHDPGQLERYRQDGHRLIDALVAHLDADQADEPARARAEAHAAAVVDELAERMSATGASLTDAVGMFVASRRPFMTELAGLGRRRALDSVRLAQLYEDASALLDRLLLRLVTGYRERAR